MPKPKPCHLLLYSTGEKAFTAEGAKSAEQRKGTMDSKTRTEGLLGVLSVLRGKIPLSRIGDHDD